jgi:hypothetical protein
VGGVTDPIVRDFPDIERLISHIFLAQLGGADHVGSETPDDLEAHLPFLRTVRSGGPRTHLVDYPTFELDLFTADGATGKPLASQVANRLLSKPPPHPSLDVVGCEPAFRELPWGDSENVRRWGATFFAETRMVRVALLP